MRVNQRLANVTVLVRTCNEAIAFHTNVLDFALTADAGTWAAASVRQW